MSEREDVLFVLKLRKNEYLITEKDEFMDNGSCVQLLTQTKRTDKWYRPLTEKLTKKAEKELEDFSKVFLKHNYGGDIKIFSLVKKISENK